MIQAINDIDRLLQAAPSRYGEAYARRLQLSASARGFDVALDATVTPSSIVFIATRVGFTGGTVEFSTNNGTPLAVDGDVAILTPAALMGSGCEVVATVTYQGDTHVGRQSMTKLLAFDSSVPPAPTGLAAQGALASINLSWHPTNDTNIAKVEIWRALDDDLAAASPVGETAGLGRTHSDVIGAAGRFYYWIRYVSKANVLGPFNAQGGTLGITGTGAEHLLELLQNQITESQLFADLRDRIDLVDAEGTGLVDRVEALVETFGDTAASAESAAQAAEAAEAAIAAKAAAILAAGDSVGAAVASNSSRLAAEAANSAAGTAASAASTSAQSASGYVTQAESAAGASNASKLAAQVARGGADTAAAAAVTARDTAVAKAGEAGTSATSASTSASTATTRAGEASAAATRAATSETNAAGSASSASTSATNAANSANAVGGSAQAAAGSASTAATHASSAGNSATAANSARVAAESARDTAAGSAGAASTSASSANTAAGSAGQSATAASQSASTASTAAGNALAYRNSAAQSATDAQGHATAAAQDVTAVNARLNNVGGSGVTVEQKLTAQADSINGLRGQAVLVIDNNGYVVGWGLASEIIDGQPTSSFIVNAANFAFVTPGAAPQVMFSGGVVNGQTVVGFSGTLIGPSGTLGSLHIAPGGGIHGGDFTSYSWPTSPGKKGFYVGPEGFMCGSVPDNRYFNADQFGDVYAPGFTIINGVPRFAGEFNDFTVSASGAAGGSYPNGSSTYGTFTISASGGRAPYQYIWSLAIRYKTSATSRININGGADVSATISGTGTNCETDATLTCVVIDANQRARVLTFNIHAQHGTPP